MIQNTKGQMIFDASDLCDLIMQGQNIAAMQEVMVDQSVDIESAATMLEDVPAFVRYSKLSDSESLEDFDRRCQANWKMPQQYKDLDIAEHILGLCKTDAELQRAGQELLMFQERNLFGLLKYLHYLVDLMTANHVIWGVGRGSSVSSYVLYLLRVHRIDSMFYELDPREFLR